MAPYSAGAEVRAAFRRQGLESKDMLKLTANSSSAAKVAMTEMARKAGLTDLPCSTGMGNAFDHTLDCNKAGILAMLTGSSCISRAYISKCSGGCTNDNKCTGLRLEGSWLREPMVVVPDSLLALSSVNFG